MPPPQSKPVRESESDSSPSEIERARRLARLLDNAITIPGSGGAGFGIDALIGLLPGVGDVLTTALSTYVVYVAARAGVPTAALGRMVGNVAIDQLVGTVPILGDLFDVAFKANARNVRILEAAIAPEKKLVPRTSRQVSLLVTVLAAVLLGIGVFSLVSTVVLIGVIVS